MHAQVDVECEFGYEYVNHACQPITGLDTSQCTAIADGTYHSSATKHRLIQGDICADISRVITDTDGKGNLPGGKGNRQHAACKKWATALVTFLVRTARSPCILLIHCYIGFVCPS